MSHSLSVEPRTAFGKGAARKLRAAGSVPAVVYSQGGEASHYTVSPTDLLEIFRTTQNANTIIDLKSGDTSIKVLVKDAERHPVSRDILHVDFLAVHEDTPVTVMVPLEAVGRPAGASLGGRLRLIRRSLKTRCTFDKIPVSHKIDVTPLHIGDMVKLSEVPLADGVELIPDSDINVLPCYGKRGGAAKKWLLAVSGSFVEASAPPDSSMWPPATTSGSWWLMPSRGGTSLASTRSRARPRWPKSAWVQPRHCSPSPKPS